MPENRIEQTTPATAANSAAPAVSPTGKPLLPPKLVPYAATLVGAAVITLAVPQLGLIAVPAAVLGSAKIVLGLGVIFGILSPGGRKSVEEILSVMRDVQGGQASPPAPLLPSPNPEGEDKPKE